jgi:hypothetical protein
MTTEGTWPSQKDEGVDQKRSCQNLPQVDRIISWAETNRIFECFYCYCL